ncbi:MAG: ABC transporter ATP-binding protein [bacterium]|nr:ABC transporter ATP-binding protein [bacterium]
MSELLRLSDLVKHYPDGHGRQLEILTGIQMSFESGKSYAVVGRSGSGKSTLLQLIGGLDHPTSGEVSFDGRSLFKMSADELAAWRNENLGFVFQSHHLLPDFTALENAMIPGLILGRSPKFAAQRAAVILDRLGLSERSHHKPGALSGGEQQRVAIARALANEPALVLADEPTGNLDPETGQSVASLLFELCRQEGKTLILVTHSPEVAARTDQQFRLEQGRLIGQED